MTQTQEIITNIRLDKLLPLRTGKVRSIYEAGDDKLVIVATDRVSAFDVIFNEGIAKKGQTLTEISKFWFDKLNVPHHLISTQIDDFPEEFKPYRSILEGRSMLVKKTEVIPVECIVRGYISGSGWKDYQNTGSVCGHTLPSGLQESQKLDTPIFTPSTKAAVGDHDENISIQKMRDLLGREISDILEHRSIEIYSKARDLAAEKGIIIADTKFEFGILDSGVLLIDEVLTPDSSRFWPKEHYVVGESPPSFDKQIIRNYAETLGWNKKAPAPPLPQDITDKTSREYQKIRDILLG